jgi:RNA polymerase sigma factor (TIGR02999 family)
MASDPTTLLAGVSGGDPEAADQLLPLVYQELRDLARAYLARERGDHTLVPTALVHEAYLKLVDQTRCDWKGRTHFKAIAAAAMQRILVDHARSRGRRKRGRGWRRVGLTDAFNLGSEPSLDPVELSDALEEMERLDSRQARVVRLRLLGGLDMSEIAELLEVSTRTVERDWKMGITWLRRQLSDRGGDA